MLNITCDFAIIAFNLNALSCFASNNHFVVNLKIANLLVGFHDLGVKASELLGGFSDKTFLPIILESLELGNCFKVLVLDLIIFLLSKEVFNISERSTHDVNKEVVHEVSVVSLIAHVRWALRHRLEHNTSIKATVFSFLAFLIVANQLSRSVQMKDHIEVVVGLNIHLNVVERIKVTSTFLDVSASIRDGALTGENFGHVIILHLCQCFFIILCASAAQVMQIVDQ
jgi:hypothetical protein